MHAASADVDAQALHALHQRGRILGVEGNVRALPLAADVHDVFGILGGELLDGSVQLLSHACLSLLARRF